MPFCLPRPFTSVAVMLENPFWSRATRTAFNFSGRIIASIFFISTSNVGSLTMLADVQSHRLFLVPDPQAHQGVDDLGYSNCDHKGVDPDGCDGYRLYSHLGWVSCHKARSANACEQAGGKYSPGAAYSVAGQDVQ